MDEVADRLSGKTITVFGCPISPITFRKAVRQIVMWSRSHHITEQPRAILLRDAHGILQGRSDHRIRALEETADLVLPDGVPIVWCLRRAGFLSAQRIYGPDLLDAVCRMTSCKKIRHGFLGGSTHFATTLAHAFPCLDIAGVLAPTIVEGIRVNHDIIERINTLNIDLLWVGLGCPKQDHWIASHRSYLNVKVLVGVGAAFDFLEGRVLQAPRGLQRLGLEWMWRLCMEPRRLGPRYIKVIPHFAMLACRDAFSRQRE